MAQVFFTDDAREDLRDLDESVRRKVLKAATKLRDSPEQRGQPLGHRQGTSLSTFRKLVVGNRDYRIIYRVEADGSVAVIWVVGQRADGEVYDMAMARLRMHGTDVADVVARALEDVWNDR